MKKKRYIKLFGWLAAATMLLTTSCKDELFTNGGGMSDEVTVSFTLTPEAAATVANRAVNYPKQGEYPHISDGSKADLLIYAVYDEEGNVIPGYGKGIVDKNGISKSDSELENLFSDHNLGENGQTIVDLEGEQFPYTFNMSFKRGSKYKIAFWAQSRKTQAYDTKDLCKVAVKYDEIKEEMAEAAKTASEGGDADGNSDDYKTTTPNNDEFRDAFCRSMVIDVSAQGSTGSLNQNVYLYRPLAQINVGTSGYDFETATRNSNKKYLYSKIRLNRVARYLNVVEDSVYLSTLDDSYSKGGDQEKKAREAFAVADFGYAPIPAYVNYKDENTIPTEKEFPSFTIWDNKYNDNKYNYPGGLTADDYAGEEFLKVKVYADMRGENGEFQGKEGEKYTKDNDGDGFLDYANLDNYDEYNSETFKYLSMCYALTSSTKENKTTLDNVKVWLATSDNPNADDFYEIELLNINQVPVQRNWRTNIVGNLLTEKETMRVELDKDFAGEYNIWSKDGKTWETTGPLADGVYYDAQADEIQISNANGLLWLQRMVNGQIVVRDTKGYGAEKVGKPLQYYDVDDPTKTKEFIYEYIDPEKLKLSDDVLRRIITATHIDDNTNLSQYKTLDSPRKVGSGIIWPYYYNFNFYNATIKLMADIDLAGIDWIPIGWDLALHDSSISAGTENLTIDYLDAEYTQGKRRIFCGTFDGNGHTIKNLKTFRVGAKVHETSLQTKDRGPYDNFQWYPYGLFGMVVDHAKIKNVRLQNVDIKGYDACGALVGIVFSGDKQVGGMLIENCYVDGGTVSVSPMYRGDDKNGTKNRTFARGVFCGGLVGNIVIANPEGNTKPQFSLNGCDVRNLTVRGYRQIGGLVGGIGNYENYRTRKDKTGTDGLDWGKNDNAFDWRKQQYDLDIKGNKISNVLIICNQFQAFNYLFNETTNDVWKNGFGWSDDYRTLAYPVVGGLYMTNDSDTETKNLIDKYNNDNPDHDNNVTIAEYATTIAADKKSRSTEISSVPLNELPMLSSWFCDNIKLKSNYYGQPSAYVEFNTPTDFAPHSLAEKDTTYKVPFRLPYDLAPDYKTTSKMAGLYVESVVLDGNRGEGGEERSVVTPVSVTEPGSCVMYVTARDRNQFIKDKNLTDQSKVIIAQPTTIKGMVLRGSPYAYTGMLIAPNENMSEVNLDGVAIYDAYQTIAKQEGTTASNVSLKVDNSNLRGYTVPGSGWKDITYSYTIFEQGSYIKAIYASESGDETQAYTYEAEANATFDHCFFKAPYIINIGDNVTLTFKNECVATAQSKTNVPIAPPTGCRKIKIDSNLNGDPVVTYCDANGTELK